jgi:hypothetical protein
VELDIIMPKAAKAVKAVQGSEQLPGKEKGLYKDAMVSMIGACSATLAALAELAQASCMPTHIQLLHRHFGRRKTTRKP